MNDSPNVFTVNQRVKPKERTQRENPNERSKYSDTTIDKALDDIKSDDNDNDSEVTLGAADPN